MSNHPMPVSVTIQTSVGRKTAERSGSVWSAVGATVEIIASGCGLDIFITAPDVELSNIRLRFREPLAQTTRVLGDHWERAYGDLEWRGIVPERPLPWYALLSSSTGTRAAGVKTSTNAFCYWQADPKGLTLTMDTRNGGRGVRLGDRRLFAATIVRETYAPDMTPFSAANDFCKKLCDAPKLPREIVYGANNWYSAYGISSEADIIADSELVASLTSGLANRPYMVIDDGWQLPDPTHPDIGPGWAGGYDWRRGNEKFPDMGALAKKIKRLGVKPGIWVRPLSADTHSKPSILLPQSRLLHPSNDALRRAFLDPTTDEAKEKIRGDIAGLADWGYELIKHDFSTWDLFGRWGFEMNASVTSGDWRFNDPTKTNAEIVRDVYQLIRDAAGEKTVIIGCNTVSHLSAGIFDIQRTGDDTSGREWEKTRKMGINTLAFRMPQHNAFYAVDGDCVGLTKAVDWTMNRQWLELLASSGTPLFVSTSPSVVTKEIRLALVDAFALASKPLPAGEPLDWMDTTCPAKWNLNGEIKIFDWYAEE
ncbi:MAG: hypothetical protein ABIH86_04215 [Planctomycetota bacterium]